MKDEKQIKKILDELDLLGEVSLAFSQISSSRMKKIRGEVLSARDFQFSIYEIFKEVLASYASEQARIAKGSKITFLAHNGKTVGLFIAANTGLYGDIVNRTFELFADDVRKGTIEVAVVGRLGLSLFQEAFPGKPYTYFDHADFGKDPDKLKEIIKHIVQYEKVQIYYGKYENVIKQIPAKYDISAEVSTEEKAGPEKNKYIFEPTVPEILSFFESELFISLFDHAISESQLAKFASRMIAMDAASQKIETKIKETFLDSIRASHASDNKKQQNAITHVFFSNII